MANGASDESSPVLCSVCMEAVSGNASNRTVVRLHCSHLFHLDCIGSAFNVSGAMQCPNCRGVENGIWRRFENDSPERNAEHDDDSDEEYVHPFAEMPNDNQSSVADLVRVNSISDIETPFCYIMLRKNLERVERRLVSTGIVPANFNHYINGPFLSNEVADSHDLPHDFGRSCSCMFNSLCTFHISTGQISAHAVPSLNLNRRIDPVRMPYLDSNAYQNVVESQLVARNLFGPSVGSTVFANNGNGVIYGFVRPPRSFPSPAVRSMSAGRIAINGFQDRSPVPAGNTERCPEQTARRINHLSSSRGFVQNQPQTSNRHNREQEGNDTEPCENLCILDLFK